MTSPRILVVEDERIMALNLRALLQRMGYTVVGVAASGPQAIDHAAQLTPDLVLMDIRLKGSMDGIEAAQCIRAERQIPVVFISAFSDERTLERAVPRQSFLFIRKPFNERSLQATLEKALNEDFSAGT